MSIRRLIFLRIRLKKPSRANNGSGLRVSPVISLSLEIRIQKLAIEGHNQAKCKKPADSSPHLSHLSVSLNPCKRTGVWYILLRNLNWIRLSAVQGNAIV